MRNMPQQRLPKAKLEELGTGRLLPLILRLAIPSIIGLSVSAAYQLLNAYFMGRLGTHAIAAVALAFPLVMLMTAVGQCMGAGAASHISRNLGRGDLSAAHMHATSGLLLGMTTASAIAALALSLAPQILVRIGATDTTLPTALIYARWMLAAYVGNAFNLICGFIVRAEGDTRLSMITQIVAFTLNALLDYVFIFILGWGVKGAVAATLLAQLAAAAIYLVHFLFSKGSIRLVRPQPGLDNMRAILSIGTPSALSLVVAVAAMAAMNKLAGQYGDTAVAGVGIATRLLTVAILPVTGLCIGAQAVLGYNMGAQNGKRVASAMRVMAGLGLAYTGTYTLMVVAFAKTFAAVFTHDPAVISIAAHAIAMFHLGLPMFAMQAMAMTLFQAEGQAFHASLVALLRQGILLLPLMLVLQHLFGMKGLVVSQTLAEIAAGAVACCLLVRQSHSLRRELGGNRGLDSGQLT